MVIRAYGLETDTVRLFSYAERPAHGCGTVSGLVEQFLCPTLKQETPSFWTPSAATRVEGGQQAVAAVGAMVLYLPPYSPDLNPIEKLFSKLKTLLRKAALRATEEHWKEIGALLNTVTDTECANYFASTGYVST